MKYYHLKFCSVRNIREEEHLWKFWKFLDISQKCLKAAQNGQKLPKSVIFRHFCVFRYIFWLKLKITIRNTSRKIFSPSRNGFKVPNMNENDQKLLFLDNFAFSSTFFGLRVKYYHVKYMHEVEHLGIPKLVWRSSLQKRKKIDKIVILRHFCIL